MATAVPWPTPDSKQRRERDHGFGPAAPDENISFPAHANLTAVEILTFLPNSVRCADVIYRLISNGGTRQSIWAILNTQRELDVAGFKTPSQCEGKHIEVPDVRFKDLVVGVRSMPQGDDALDLTRMVRYCMKKPNEPWSYPRDYDKLLCFLGGPAPMRKEHADRAAFGRWAKITPPSPRLRPASLPSVLHTEPNEKKRNRACSFRKDTYMVRMRSREAAPAVVPAKKGGRPKGRPKKGASIEEAEAWQPMGFDKENEPDIRYAAEFTAAPNDVEAPANEEVDLAFLKEGFMGEDYPFSPYSFGGPRCSPPYRMLHCIAQPVPEDKSGWAENLRWACEQRACFSHSFKTDTWNESPKHMEFIAKTRKEKVWVSDELLELFVREEDNERQLYYPEAR